MYYINLYYDDPNNNNRNRSNRNNILSVDILSSKCSSNNIIKFLNDPINKHDISFKCTIITKVIVNDILARFIKYLPHAGGTLRINDTFVDDKTGHDDHGMRTPYPSDQELVAQIMSMLDA